MKVSKKIQLNHDDIVAAIGQYAGLGNDGGTITIRVIEKWLDEDGNPPTEEDYQHEQYFQDTFRKVTTFAAVVVAD